MWSPLEAFFDGIGSIVGRFFVALLVLFAGFSTAAPWNMNYNFFLSWCVYSIFMPMEWATCFSGFGVLIGFAAIVLFFYFIILYVFEWGWETSTVIFWMYAPATAYLLPIDEHEYGVFRVICYFSAVSFFLWGLPRIFRRIRN